MKNKDPRLMSIEEINELTAKLASKVRETCLKTEKKLNILLAKHGMKGEIGIHIKPLDELSEPNNLKE